MVREITKEEAMAKAWQMFKKHYPYIPSEDVGKEVEIIDTYFFEKFISKGEGLKKEELQEQGGTPCYRIVISYSKYYLPYKFEVLLGKETGELLGTSPLDYYDRDNDKEREEKPKHQRGSCPFTFGFRIF